MERSRLYICVDVPLGREICHFFVRSVNTLIYLCIEILGTIIMELYKTSIIYIEI